MAKRPPSTSRRRPTQPLGDRWCRVDNAKRKQLCSFLAASQSRVRTWQFPSPLSCLSSYDATPTTRATSATATCRYPHGAKSKMLPTVMASEKESFIRNKEWMCSRIRSNNRKIKPPLSHLPASLHGFPKTHPHVGLYLPVGRNSLSRTASQLHGVRQVMGPDD